MGHMQTLQNAASDQGVIYFLTEIPNFLFE